MNTSKLYPKSLHQGDGHVTNPPAAALAIAACTNITDSNELGLAACSFEISAESSQQIFPAGQFQSTDGQSDAVEVGFWNIDAAIAKQVIADRAKKANDLLFDYEHQTLNAEKNGQAAPAAGWAKNANLEWVDGQGLFVKNVEWTAKAKQLIQDKEYRYISPVFSYDKKTGAIVSLKHIAITNDPAIDGMQSLVALKHTSTPTLENTMHPTIVDLLAAIGITIDPNKDLDIAALTALLDSKDAKTGIASLKASLAEFATQTTEIAALKAKSTEGVDLTKHVPVETYNAVVVEMAALKANNESITVEQTIEQAKKDGKFIAAGEIEYLKNLGNTNIAALKSTLDGRPTVAAFAGKQTTEQKPDEQDNTGVAALTADHKLIAGQLGISHEDYAKQLAAEA
ncbi:phage protease [uncultured Paraglaciecola sp.]|uniref:phage protease n=1 Tax=uncultured Paraglaciecola sp. TaxID=1765024 RepID=UPI002626F68B|nr:phage protease [uncultured Paraglaciecola sp.]